MEKTLDLNLPGVMELGREELKEVDGGTPWIFFVAGALVGGVIYDAYKAGSIALIQGRLEHPEYYEGVPQHL